MSSPWRAAFGVSALIAAVIAACGLPGATASSTGAGGMGEAGSTPASTGSASAASTLHGSSSSSSDASTGAGAGGSANSSTSGTGGAAPMNVIIEAENYNGSTSPLESWMRASSIPNASGGNYMQCGPDDGASCDATTMPGSCASLVYDVTLPAAATYWFQVRMYATGTSQNSLWYAIDGAVDPTSIQFTTYDAWVWITGASHSLAAGPHTITLYQRECGACVDELALTTTATPPS